MGDSTSDKPQINPETLDALGDNFVEDVSRYVLPIFTDKDNVPVSVGTGFLLDTEFGHALVTAAHVLDGFYSGREYYFYAAPAVRRGIAGQALFSKVPPSGNRDDDLVDVVIVLLEGDADELPPFESVSKLRDMRSSGFRRRRANSTESTKKCDRRRTPTSLRRRVRTPTHRLPSARRFISSCPLTNAM
jgi:hypothetical protein